MSTIRRDVYYDDDRAFIEEELDKERARTAHQRAQARRAEEARRRVRELTSHAPSTFEPLPVAPLHSVSDIGPLYHQPRRHLHAASPTRSRDIDALLAKHGIRPRR